MIINAKHELKNVNYYIEILRIHIKIVSRNIKIKGKPGKV